jgi:hypothetical protein
MAFDPSSAEPVSGGFDPSTAAPAPESRLTLTGPDTDPFGARVEAAPEEEGAVSPVTVTAPRRKESLGTQVKGFGRSLAGGLAFNFNDEIEAAFRSGRISGPQYKALRNQIRDEQNRYQALHPIAAGTANVAGALIPAAGALILSGGTAAPLAAARVAGPLAMLGRAAAIGATEGALTGYGGSKEKFTPDAAVEAAKGAAAGAVLAPIVAAAPSLVGKGFGALKNLLVKPSEAKVTQRALEVTVEAMRRQGKTPAEIELEIARLRDQGVPVTLGEQGAPGVTAKVMTMPEGAPLAASTAADQAEAAARTGQQVTDRVTKGVDYDASRQGVVDRMRAEAEPAYAKAYQYGEVDDPIIKNILDLPVMSSFWSDAMAAAERDASVIAAKTGKPPVNPLRDYLTPTGRKSTILGSDGKPFEITEYAPTGDKVPTVEVLDWLKRGMDEAIDRGYRGGGMGAKGASDFRQIRDALTGRLDDVVPDYKTARGVFKGHAETRDAYDFGMGENLGRGKKSLETMRPAQLDAWMKDASDAEKQAAFAGYGNFLFNKLATATNPAAFVGNPARLSRLRSLTNDPADIDLLETALKREAELFAQRGKALQGVSAAVKKAAQDDMAVALDAGDSDLISTALRANTPGWFIGSTLRVLANKAKYPPETVAKLTDVLGSGTPDEVAQVVADLTAAAAAMAPRLRRQEITRDLAAVAAGAVAAGHGEPGETASREPYSYGPAADEEAVGEEAVGEEAPAEEFVPPPPKTGVPEDTARLVYDLTPDEAKALAVVGEAGPDKGEMQAVALVLENRAKSPNRYGNSIYSILTGGEFDAFKTNPKKLQKLMASDRYQQALQIVKEGGAGEGIDPRLTSTTTHFLAPALMKQKGYPMPSWAKDGFMIGDTMFFNDVK